MLTNPWAIFIGIAAATLPVIIHWLTRPRPVRFPVSTLRFIKGAVAQRRARYRLRDLLVLLFRTAAVLLLAFAIARPLLHQKKTTAGDKTSAVTRVILLDCSQSMAARDGGIVRFERARPIVSDLLKYEPSIKCNLLLAGAAPDSVFDSPTTNLAALREALSGSAVRPERLRVHQALNRVVEMFEQADPESKLELFVISDFQRSNWGTVDFSVLPQGCDTQLRSVASEEKSANLAVLDLSTTGRIEAGTEADISIRLGNFSDTPRNVRVEVSLGSVRIPVDGYCPARSQTSLVAKVPINSQGWHTGAARLIAVDDVLPSDDSLAIGIQAQPQPRVAILTRDKVGKTASTAWYIEQALKATFATTDTSDAMFFVDAAVPDVEALRTADIVIAARPGRLSKDATAVLTAMLQRGRSLLYIGADQLDATNLHELVASLGSAASMPVEYLPRPGDRGGERRFLTDVDRRRSPFMIFGDELSAAIRSLEFVGGLMSRSTAEGLADDVRATLSDQSSFLTVTSAGRGKLAVLNVDLERSNLARSPVFVPLLGELISQDLAASADTQSTFHCGEPFTVQLPVGEEHLDELSVTYSGGTVSERAGGSFSPVPGGIVWDVPQAGPAGVYEVQLAGKSVSAAATSIPDEESDLRTLSAEVFEGRLSGGHELQFGTGSLSGEDHQDITWVWLAAGCMACMLLEMFTLKMFRA